MKVPAALLTAALAGLLLPGQVWAQTINPSTVLDGSSLQSPAPAQAKTSAPANVTVNVTPPAPDPAATQAMYDHFIANAEYDHAAVPITWATGLLNSDNIWTSTPWSMIDTPVARNIRNVARLVAIALFGLGVLYVGCQLAFGSITGTTNYQMLLPMMVIGFMLAMYTDLIAHRAVDLCNWLDVQFGDSTLAGFSGAALVPPERPAVNSVPGIVGVPAAFFSGLITTLLYAIVLVILEMKLIFRDGILIVTTTVMPVSGVLYAFSITRGWGTTLFRLFFGWLYGQPLVVICLGLAGSLLTLFNDSDGVAAVLVKLAVLFVAMKALTMFAGGGLGNGAGFGFAALLTLLRRLPNFSRGQAAATATTPPPQYPLHQSGYAFGTGNGTAATARPWRPSYGTA